MKREEESFPGGASDKEPPANAGDVRDVSSIPKLGISPEEGNSNPIQYSCLENPNGERNPAGCSPWGRFYVLAILSSVTMNTGVHAIF